MTALWTRARRSVSALVLGVAVVLASCTPSAQLPPIRDVAPPGVGSSSFAWVGSGEILVNVFPGEAPFLTELVLLDVASGAITPFPMEAPPECQRVEFDEMSPAEGGRVHVIRVCLLELPDQTLEVLEIDVPSRTVTEVLPGPQGYGPTGFGLLPDGGGWFSSGSRLCGGVGRFDANGNFVDLPITVGDPDAPIDLDWYFHDAPGAQCGGVADEVVLDRDGRRIAFIAAPETARQSGGHGRLFADWSIYVMDLEGPEANKPRLVYEGVEAGIGLAWSPDGTTFSIAGTIDGVKGTWLVPIDGGPPTRIAAEMLTGSAFSPDGTQLLGSTLRDLKVQLVLVDLPAAP